MTKFCEYKCIGPFISYNNLIAFSIHEDFLNCEGRNPLKMETNLSLFLGSL